MSTITLTNYDSREVEDMQRMEKFGRREKAKMPVHRSHTAISASHRTPASRRTSRQNSRRNSGKHRRRLRRGS